MNLKSILAFTTATVVGLSLSASLARPAAAEELSDADLAALSQSLQQLNQALQELNQQLTNAPTDTPTTAQPEIPTQPQPAPVQNKRSGSNSQNPFYSPHFSGADAFNGGNAFNAFK